MWGIFTKWGTIIIVTTLVASLVAVFSSSVSGISTWISDNYLPKQYVVLEKYPVRIILYGQVSDMVENVIDGNTSSLSHIRTSNIIKIIEAMDAVHYYDGNFSSYKIDVNFNSNFNSKQIRSTNRRAIIANPDVEGE